MRTRIGIASAFCAVLLVMTACGGGSGDDTATRAASGNLPYGFAAPEKKTLKIGVADLDPGEAPTLLADELDTYKKYGIDADVSIFDGASKVTQALIAGQIDVGMFSAGPVIASTLTDRPLLSVAVFGGNMDYVLMGGKDYQQGDSLKGKSIAISTFGSVSHVAAMAAVKEQGLQPDDVTYTQIGGSAARLAALVGGSVAAAPFVQGERAGAEKAGAKLIVDLSKIDGPESKIASATIVVTKDFSAKNPNTITAVLAADVEALQTVYRDPEQAVAAYAKVADISKEEASAKLDAQKASFTRDGRPQQAMFDNILTALADTDARLKNVKSTDAYTMEYIEKLDASGIFQDLGVETTKE